jgi:putative transport protein
MIGELLRNQPEFALFASLALGYLIGSVKIRSIQLGGVCGTLIVALVLGQSGARISPDLKNIAFALFIFALGFTGGPQFFANAWRGWRYGVLSLIEVFTVLALVFTAIALLGLDQGTAAGLLAGAATESAVIGTASEAIARLGLPAAETARLQANIATAYSVSYLFGLVSIVLFTSQFAPLLLRIDLRAEAEQLWHKLGGNGALESGQRFATPSLVGREFRVGPAADLKVGQLEAHYGYNLAVEAVLRDATPLTVTAGLVLQKGDHIVVTGRRNTLIQAAISIGEELPGHDVANIRMQQLDVVLTRREAHGLSVAQMRERAAPEAGRGVFIAALTRLDSTVPALPGTILNRGDVLTLAGAAAEVQRAAAQLGYVLPATNKTDFVMLGVGVLLGMAFGHLSVHLGDVTLSLGMGGGCLLSGLLCGWLRAHRPVIGALPSGAAQILKDFGLGTFIAAVGLSAGPDALALVRQYGFALPVVGVLMVLVPGLLSLFIGRVFLKLDAPMLLGAIAGQQCSTPAISALVSAAGNSTPIIGYTITYALSNVLLPLAGPIVVGFGSGVRALHP